MFCVTQLKFRNEVLTNMLRAWLKKLAHCAAFQWLFHDVWGQCVKSLWKQTLKWIFESQIRQIWPNRSSEIIDIIPLGYDYLERTICGIKVDFNLSIAIYNQSKEYIHTHCILKASVHMKYITNRFWQTYVSSAKSFCEILEKESVDNK